MFARRALQAIPKTQRHVFWTYDGCKNAYCSSRRWRFYKYHDDSALKITYFDNFRCSGNGVSCRYEVTIPAFSLAKRLQTIFLASSTCLAQFCRPMVARRLTTLLRQ